MGRTDGTVRNPHYVEVTYRLELIVYMSKNCAESAVLARPLLGGEYSFLCLGGRIRKCE